MLTIIHFKLFMNFNKKNFIKKNFCFLKKIVCIIFKYLNLRDVGELIITFLINT